MRSSFLIAVFLALGLGAWLASPYLLPAKEVESGAVEAVLDEPIEQPLFKVATRQSKAQTVTRELILNARSEAARRVMLRAEIDGRVVALPVAKGSMVEAGALVAELDQRDREAWRDMAAAMLKERELEFQAARRLGEKGFQAETRVAEALAQLEEAEATVRQREIAIEHGTIEASFAGILHSRPVEIGDFLQAGDPIGEIVELDPLVVAADVPEAQIHHLVGDVGARVEFQGFGVHEGRVRYLAREADRSTRTFRIEIELPNPDLLLPAGVSTRAILAFAETEAHPLPSSLLTLDDAGRIGIKAVDDDGIVAFHNARIIRTETDVIWLADLPAEIDVITVGHGFVAPGQHVTPVREDQAEATPPAVALRSD